MDRPLLAIAVAAFASALFLKISSSVLTRGLVGLAIPSRLLVLLLAWMCLFLAQAQVVEHEGTGVGFAAALQASWVALGAALAFMARGENALRIPTGPRALVALAAYGVAAAISSVYAPDRLLSLYKAVVLLVDCYLVAASISELRNLPPLYRRLPYDVVVAMTLGVVFMAGLVGTVAPELAFRQIYGAYTDVLDSVLPRVHANELGMLSVIGIVISVNRIFRGRRSPLLWVPVLLLCACVAYYAQARTSLVALFLATLLLPFLSRSRTSRVLGICLLGCGMAAFATLGPDLFGGSGSTVEEYLRRGASDEHLENLSGRTELWRAGLEMLSDSPIVGHGYDSGVRLLGERYNIPEGTNMHSAHLQILANTGFLGYIPWLAFIALMSQIVWHHRREVGEIPVEHVLVLFVIVFRTFFGHVLVTHHFSFLLALAVMVHASARSSRAS